MKKIFQLQGLICIMILFSTQLLAQNLKEYSVLESKVVGDVTIKTIGIVNEDQFGNKIVSSKLYMTEKKNGDYWVSISSNFSHMPDLVKYKYTVPKFDSNELNKLTAVIGTVYTYENGAQTITYPNGNEIINITREEDLVQYRNFTGEKNDWGNYYVRGAFVTPHPSYKSARRQVFFLEAKTKKAYNAVYDLPIIGSKDLETKLDSRTTTRTVKETLESGFTKPGDNRVYFVSKAGELIPFLQEVPNDNEFSHSNDNPNYYYAGPKDTIVKVTLDPLVIQYTRGDVVQYPGPNIRLHRNGGTFLRNLSGFSLKLPNGSKFEYKETPASWNNWLSFLVYENLPFTDGWLTKADGTKEEYKNGVNMAKKAAEEKAAEQRKYNERCRKWGKANIDRLKRETVWVGMPEGLMKETYTCTIEYKSATSTQYYLYNLFNNPLYSVWVSNGRITSISKF